MEEILDDEQATSRAQPPAPSLLELWRRWRKAVNDRAALLALDAHSRRDIGLTAAEIDDAVRLPWWRWPLNCVCEWAGWARREKSSLARLPSAPSPPRCRRR